MRTNFELLDDNDTDTLFELLDDNDTLEDNDTLDDNDTSDDFDKLNDDLKYDEYLQITITDDDNRNITFTYEDEVRSKPFELVRSKTFELERPQAELNIFDSKYYLDNNPDVAEDINERYDKRYNDIDVSVQLDRAELSNPNNTSSFSDYGGAVAHYDAHGATERRDPSPLFDTQYYLQQNPDVASALAGGNFNGDPLLHYVEAGATEGRDPNPYFDSDYYLAQNPGITEAGLNPLEHYVLFGSSSGADPSPNFDPNYYLEQNPDVLAAGIDPLTHFLVFGRDEGRLPMAE